MSVTWYTMQKPFTYTAERFVHFKFVMRGDVNGYAYNQKVLIIVWTILFSLQMLRNENDST
jgi:hypothetical protein